MPPISKSGFLIGATLALAAGVVKIVFLRDAEGKEQEAPETARRDDEAFTPAPHPAPAGR